MRLKMNAVHAPTRARSRSQACAAWRVLTSALCVALVGSPAIAFDVNTHAAISAIAVSDHPESQVEAFLKTQIGSPMGLNESALQLDAETGAFSSPHTLVEWLVLGAMDEDEGVRPLRHFYNPLRKEGLSDVTLCGAERTLRAFPGSVTWAWSNAGASGDMPRHGWQDARRAYFRWLTATAVEEAGDALAKTFKSLGHVIHLLQDTAQPQHARNDAHLTHSFSTVFGGVTGEGAPFEEFCALNFGDPAAIRALGDVRVPRLPPPTRAPGGIDPRFHAFWDTFQYARSERDISDPRGLDPDSLGLAEFSCAYFVTDDTMFTDEPAFQLYTELGTPGGIYQILSGNPQVHWRHRFRSPSLREVAGWSDALGPADRVGAGAVSLVRYGEGNCLAVSGEQFFASSRQLRHKQLNIDNYCSARVIGNELFVGLNSLNRAAHAKALLPRAVAYSTGLLNYFFRGKLNCQLTVSECSEDTRALLEITNVSEDDFTGGEFILLEDDGYGTSRRVLGSFELNQARLSGELPAGGSMSARMRGLVVRGRPFVVYRGTIGSEENIAVATGLAPVRATSADNLTFDGGFGVRPVAPEATRLELEPPTGGPYSSHSSVRFRARLVRELDEQGIPCRQIWFFVHSNGSWIRVSLGRDSNGHSIFPKTDSDGWAEATWTLPTVNAREDEIRQWSIYARFENNSLAADYFEDSESERSSISVRR